MNKSSTTNSELSQEAIRKTLAHHAGSVPDASAVAEATISIWHQIVIRLAPVIGAHGVDVLFRRSLYLASAAFPWLATADDPGDSAALFANIKTRLEGRETNVAMEASYTLLVTFTELLTSLIGESLTERLLGPVWVAPAAIPEKETVS